MQRHYAINIRPIMFDLKMGLQAEVKVHDMVALFSPFNTKLFGATGTHEPSKITIHEMHQLKTLVGNQTSLQDIPFHLADWPLKIHRSRLGCR